MTENSIEINRFLLTVEMTILFYVLSFNLIQKRPAVIGKPLINILKFRQINYSLPVDWLCPWWPRSTCLYCILFYFDAII